MIQMTSLVVLKPPFFWAHSMGSND
jgi:hypothetical protein